MKLVSASSHPTRFHQCRTEPCLLCKCPVLFQVGCDPAAGGPAGALLQQGGGDCRPLSPHLRLQRTGVRRHRGLTASVLLQQVRKLNWIAEPELSLLLGTRGAVLHHSAETVLCFRNQVVVVLSCLVVLSCCCLVLSEYQSSERKPAYGVERAPCAFHNHSCLLFCFLSVLAHSCFRIIAQLPKDNYILVKENSG